LAQVNVKQHHQPVQTISRTSTVTHTCKCTELKYMLNTTRPQ